MNQKTIRIQGHGSVAQAPDRIRIQSTISAMDTGFAQAIEKCNAGIEAVRSAALSCGIDPAELKTVHFNVAEQTEYLGGRHQHIGFESTHQIAIVLPIDKMLIGNFLTAVIRSQASPRLNLSFEVSDPEGLRQQVLASAVGNAQRRAETITAAAGIQLGGILHIEYGYAEVRIASPGCEMVCESEAPMSSVAPDFEPEDIRADDTVTVTWEIAP